ncbi:sulfatase-like hydrolase/transferase [Sediminibacterium soli]|uniref:sulfatase-like hydrolase/transferase n=1 Tax=Sediminibacterium soli TaxID=2698829 RepID=UPI001379858F|nr:sulfatase-like hydrolase/transferase [Sediminibacterium soli]NCI47188.1 sulfatase-like hydrolase/transferase [Sediminibacterium soli]
MPATIVVNILFDILTYGIFAYSVLLLLSYIFIGVFSIGETSQYMHRNKFADFRVLASSAHAPTVSILAPAYNEGMTIVENVRSLLSIYYTNLEVIVINDGSKDDSLQKLIEAYDLEKLDFFVDYKIDTKPVRGVYRSRKSIHHKLIVVDKVNGGKADALNVGINVSSNDYLVCIDVDCILEQDALLKMIKPFMEETGEKVIASGGVVRIANSCEIEDGKLVKVRLATDYLPRMQILEYIRAFILGRMAWSRLNGLMLISGAFGAFDKEIAIKAGGYNHNTVGEDMELVVRMRRYMEERKQNYRVTYIPDPLCWTEAPSTFNILGRQRNRWTRGTIETLRFHKVMFFNPKYHLLGMISYPYWFFFEMCAPVIEFFGFVCFFLFASFGLMDWSFFFCYFLFIVCFGFLYSSFAILMEVLTFHQYKRRTDILILLLTALTEPFYFHPFVVLSAIKGFIDYLRKKKSWGEMTRQGFAKKTDAAATTVTPQAVTPPPPPVETTTEQPGFFRDPMAAIGRLPGKLFEAFRYFASHAIVLLLLLLLARTAELGYAFFKNGLPETPGKLVLYSLLKDLVFFGQFCGLAVIPYAFLYLVHRRLAAILFITFSVLLLLVQAGLVQYFLTTLVPLGADLWVYTMDDIKQTVNAAGGISATAVIGLVLIIAIGILAFVFLSRRVRPGKAVATLLLLLITGSSIRILRGGMNPLLLKQEYANNLALNKAQFFLASTFTYFFNRDQDSDTNGYAENQPGDNGDALIRYNYIDEKNFPFLHTTDSSWETLSPFFRKDSAPPNIVIVLVEGLGRAFTGRDALLGNFTPFIDSLSQQGLFWQNFLSEGGRSFAALPSILGSLPFARNGFSGLDNAMPRHLSLLNILQNNGYQTAFYYGGDAHFDNMDMYLQRNRVDSIHDVKSFPPGYIKMPETPTGTSWGYGDKELFRRFFDGKPQEQRPYLNLVLTVSTHSPFRINEQPQYLSRFEQRMTELGLDEPRKRQYRAYADQYAGILYADDALRYFFTEYSKRADFNHTIFLVTGDHRMPEIPMSTKIDRYHVPLIVYSPLLLRKTQFASLSTHFDITPALLMLLQKQYGLNVPKTAAWMGASLDTARQFRNLHAYPLMQTKNEIVDFVMGDYLLNGNELYKLNGTMDASLEQNDIRKARMRSAFNRFKARNNAFVGTLKIVPDSLLEKYAPR